MRKGRYLVKISGIFEVEGVPLKVTEGDNKLRVFQSWETEKYLREELKKMQEEGLFDTMFDVDIMDYVLISKEKE